MGSRNAYGGSENFPVEAFARRLARLHNRRVPTIVISQSLESIAPLLQRLRHNDFSLIDLNPLWGLEPNVGSHISLLRLPNIVRNQPVTPGA